MIIAKISSSKCQFDTSTDALIQLKQSGVSAAVLKAIVSASSSKSWKEELLVAEELKDSGSGYRAFGDRPSIRVDWDARVVYSPA